ncbi:DUF4386 domain-containing protein [candidate division KSB1 bacterium]|nr:DUF4386 domain-containing protein [candidate division KSB1 bacterium]
MYEEMIKSQVMVYRVAAYIAIIAAMLIFLGLVGLLIFPFPDAQSSLSERLHFIAKNLVVWRLQFSILFLVVMCQIPIIWGFYHLTRRQNSMNASLAVILGFLAVSIVLQQIFGLVIAIPKMAKIYAITGDELLKYSILANFNAWGLIQTHSLSYSAVLLACFLFGLMNLLFGLNLLRSLKLVRIIGWLLFGAGCFSGLGLIGLSVDMRVIEIGFLVQLALYFSALILMFPMFRHEAFLNQSIQEKGTASASAARA